LILHSFSFFDRLAVGRVKLYRGRELRENLYISVDQCVWIIWKKLFVLSIAFWYWLLLFHSNTLWEKMNEDDEKAARRNKLLQPPPRRFVKPNEASSTASRTNWRSASRQNLLSQRGNHQGGKTGPGLNDGPQQYSNSGPYQRRPNSNNNGSRQPYTPPAPFSTLLLEIQDEEANKVIS
jgi:hypothetical protein